MCVDNLEDRKGYTKKQKMVRYLIDNRIFIMHFHQASNDLTGPAIRLKWATRHVIARERILKCILENYF